MSSILTFVPLLFLSCFSVQVISVPPKFINLGLFGEKFISDGVVNVPGTQAIAAMVMAIKEINDKKDGRADFLLPQTKIRFALRETGGDYLKASLAAQDFSLKVFNGSGVVGAIGTGYDTSSKAVGQTFSNTKFKITNIDYYANDSELSHSGTYSYYARVVASRGYSGRILARLVKYYFGWTTVNVFSTSDTYGTDTSSEFFLEAAALGLDVENKNTFWPGTKDFSSIIQNTMSRGILKVFVLLMQSEDAGALLEAGYNAGLFKVGTQILGTEYILQPKTWTSMSPKAPVEKIMKGVIGINAVQTRNTTSFQSFLKRFTSQKSTKYTLSDGSVVCDKSKDDDGGKYLYASDDGDDDADDCAGIDFKAMSKTGEDLHDMAAYAYDATYALSGTLHDILYNQKIQNFTGDDILYSLIYRVVFTGTTGTMDFFEGLGGLEGYGKGDRQSGLRYTLLNFNPMLYHKNSKNQYQPVRVIGNWRNGQTTFVPCDKFNDDLCTDPVYNTVDGNPVVNEPTIVEVQIEDWVRNLLRAGGALGLLIVVVFLSVWLLFLDTKLIKATQPIIMFIVLLGGTCGGIEVFLLSMDITDTTCMAGMWLGHFAFGLVFAALLARTWRISKIINSGFSKVKVSADKMYRVMGLGLVLFCAILAVDTAIGRPHRSYEESFDGHNNVRLVRCKNDNPTVTMALFGIEGLMLFYGAKLCWDTKDAPGSVNDAASISLALYLILFVCAVTFPIVFLSIDPTPQNLIIVMGVGYIVALVGVLTIIFGNKTLLVLEGGEIDNNFNIVKSDPHSSLQDRAKKITANVARKMKSRVTKVSSGGKYEESADPRNETLDKPMKMPRFNKTEVDLPSVHGMTTPKYSKLEEPLSIGGMMAKYNKLDVDPPSVGGIVRSVHPISEGMEDSFHPPRKAEGKDNESVVTDDT